MSEAMHFYQPEQGHGLPHDPFNAIVGPRPIGWISTQNAQGRPNLAPYSFFNAFNYTPPIIGFCSVGAKDSLRNIQETGEFVWNLVTMPLAEQMNQSCAAVPPEINEFELAGLETAASRCVKPPRVALSPVAFECRMSQIVQLQSASGVQVPSFLVLGEVVGVHIRQDLLKNGVYDTASAQHVLRGGGPGDYFTVTPENLFTMLRPR